MFYYFTTDCLVDNCMLHISTEGKTWEEAYGKAINLAQKSPVMDSGCVDFDIGYYKRLSFVDDNKKMADFFLISKKDFLKLYSYITEEEYFATQIVLHDMFLKKYMKGEN